MNTADSLRANNNPETASTRDTDPSYAKHFVSDFNLNTSNSLGRYATSKKQRAVTP